MSSYSWHAAGAAEREGEAGDHACRPNSLGSTAHLHPQNFGMHAVWATDTIQLECLAWAVFDNVMGPGKMPQLSGFETYGQILRCLVDKGIQRTTHALSSMYICLIWHGGNNNKVKTWRPGAPEA